MSGNHNADAGEKEYQDRGKCICGEHAWSEGIWCTHWDEECIKCMECKTSDVFSNAVTRLKCGACGAIREG